MAFLFENSAIVSTSAIYTFNATANTTLNIKDLTENA